MDPKSLGLDVTKEQAILIVRTWRKDDFGWLFKIGMAIYSQIFNIAPEAKKFFPYVIQAEKSCVPFCDCTGFRRQALRFVQALSQVVIALEETDQDEEDFLENFKLDVSSDNSHHACRRQEKTDGEKARKEDLARYFHNIGRRHRRVAADRNFKPELWQIFRASMVHVMREELERHPALTPAERRFAADGWSVVADFIIREMENGFKNGSVDIVDVTKCFLSSFKRSSINRRYFNEEKKYNEKLVGEVGRKAILVKCSSKTRCNKDTFLGTADDLFDNDSQVHKCRGEQIMDQFNSINLIATDAALTHHLFKIKIRDYMINRRLSRRALIGRRAYQLF
uniref:Globin family profile domain-containing protein n=1 Tax=Romanomermis culicivorax TaxID=13658 RepID=A0A915J7Q9_ROMCU